MSVEEHIFLNRIENFAVNRYKLHDAQCSIQGDLAVVNSRKGILQLHLQARKLSYFPFEYLEDTESIESALTALTTANNILSDQTLSQQPQGFQNNELRILPIKSSPLMNVYVYEDAQQKLVLRYTFPRVGLDMIQEAIANRIAAQSYCNPIVATPFVQVMPFLDGDPRVITPREKQELNYSLGNLPFIISDNGEIFPNGRCIDLVEPYLENQNRVPVQVALKELFS